MRVASLRTRVLRLERRVNVERRGFAWLDPDGSIIFEGEVFRDRAEFENVWQGRGYARMCLVTWDLDVPCEKQVFRGPEALEPQCMGETGIQEGRS